MAGFSLLNYISTSIYIFVLRWNLDYSNIITLQFLLGQEKSVLARIKTVGSDIFGILTQSLSN